MSLIQISDDVHNNCLYTNAQTLREINIKTDKIVLHFGTLKNKMSVHVDNKIQSNSIIIPRNITSNISIPDVLYDYYFRGNHLFLGPVIGFLTSKFYKKPDKTVPRFMNYENTKGLIFVFLKKLINMEDKTIKGYYFDHKNQTFVEGIFPYPNAVYCQQHLEKSYFKHLTKFVGRNKIFNHPCNINKLNLWNILSKNSEIRKHLPRTGTYRSTAQLSQFLEHHDSVYLKPINKCGGIGIFHVKKFEDKIVLTDTNYRQYFLKNRKDLKKILNKRLKKKRTYLMQQDIPYKYKEQKVDFRIYIQKDYKKVWKYSGMETKIAKKASIISNKKNRALMMPAETALREIFSLDSNKAKEIIEETANLCIKALREIEESGYQLGDAAIDLIIDENLKIWILEVQLVYAALRKVRRTKDEKKVLPAVLPTPFEYARALSGF